MDKPSRPTKIPCQTKFSCNTNEIASYFCVGCDGYFCQKCLKKHSAHRYKELKKFKSSDICEGNCRTKSANLADLYCTECKKRFCCACFKESDKKHFNSKKYEMIDFDSEDDDNNFMSVQLSSIPHPQQLFNEDEHFNFTSAANLAESLRVKPDDKLLVISVIGRTGDGKSHLLNHTFFGGHPVFVTDSSQNRCTIGAWTAVAKDNDRDLCYMLIDTEGLQGESKSPDVQRRLLMKIMAVSDLVLYRTRDSRLNQEIFELIADAWHAFDKYFKTQLEVKANEFKCKVEMLTPTFLLIHTVEHTDLVPNDRFILDRIKEAKPDLRLGFSNVFYVGFKPTENGNRELIDYKKLNKEIKEKIEHLNIRAPRTCEFIFSCMKMLNDTFNKKIESKPTSVFPDEFFCCNAICQSCNKNCELTMNHSGRHRNGASCVLTSKLENYIYLCRVCCESTGCEKPLVPKPMASNDTIVSGTFSYLWSGFILECDKCGIIYRSREYWYGNECPTKHPRIKQKIIHFWLGDKSLISSIHPIGQRWTESLSEISTQVANWSNPALKVVKDGIVDACLPSQMQRNSEINECGVCNRSLNTLTDPVHHCRQCSKGVCDVCSNYEIDFPKRGKQRVCKRCFDDSSKDGFKKKILPEDTSSYQAYKIAEKTTSLIGAIAKAPLSVAKFATQPSYWQADSQCRDCPLCKLEFHPNWRKIHHCRACGLGVCDECSQKRMPVPVRGIDHPQRICDSCVEQKLFELPFE